MKVILDPFAHLPIPVSDEVFLVKHVLGTFVPWPRNLVLQGNVDEVKYKIILSYGYISLLFFLLINLKSFRFSNKEKRKGKKTHSPPLEHITQPQ